MPKLLFLFLALLLNYITNLETRLNAAQEKAIEFQIGSPTVFGRDRNFFKFSYYGSNDAKIIFYFDNDFSHFEHDELYLIDPENGRYYLGTIDYHYSFAGNLTYNGTYYLELICQSIICELGGNFYSSIIGNIETIDLNNNIYYENIEYSSKNYLGMKKYKVHNLKEEKLVYFSVYGMSDYDLEKYYPFYPGESPPYSYEHDFSNLTIFEIFNVNTQKNERNVRLYKFEPNQEYIINIHCLKRYDDDYYYYRYLFFPLTNSHIKTFTGEENIIIPEGPMFGIVNQKIQRDFEIKTDMYTYYVVTNETIENNLEVLSSLQFTYTYRDIQIKKGRTNNTIIFFIPINLKIRIKYFLLMKSFMQVNLPLLFYLLINLC